MARSVHRLPTWRSTGATEATESLHSRKTSEGYNLSHPLLDFRALTLKLSLSFFVRLDPFPNGFGFLDVRFGVFDATVAVALADCQATLDGRGIPIAWRPLPVVNGLVV